MRCLELLFVFQVTQVYTLMRRDDVFMFDKDFSETFLPANQISEDYDVLPSARHRVYAYRPSKFRVSFNAALCYGLNHTIVVSFMEHWADAVRIPPPLMMKNSFVLSKNSDDDAKGAIPLAITKFPYSVTGYTQGAQVFSAAEKFTMITGHFYVRITRNEVQFIVLSTTADTGDVFEKTQLAINFTKSSPRYIALFGTNMQHCPVFISGVSI
ncbi:hypothetical protein RB195_009869 [Necator americanus]|uniref:Uncharacterized protein n=1 Tax=Necator americanus TaxID=51031 RepID=A0ABR1CVB0_NECAM